jgi:hypothetical protein
MKLVILTDTFRNGKESAEDADYEEHGCDQILPKCVRMLRDRLLSGNSLSNLQAYCIILLGIKLFLRADEALEIEIDHFITGLFVEYGGRIEALALKVKGMKNQKW